MLSATKNLYNQLRSRTFLAETFPTRPIFNEICGKMTVPSVTLYSHQHSSNDHASAMMKYHEKITAL
jgi:hypothetical protein